MNTLESLNLPHLPVETPEFAADPVRYFRQASEVHPWLATSDVGLLIHELSAIRELLGQDKKFRPAYDGIVDQLGAHGTPWGRFTENQMISLPVAEHRLLRDTFARKFTPRFANQLRPMMKATVTRLLDEWAPKGSFDFEEFSSYFPISNMFTMVGAPLDEVPGIRSSLETLGLAFSMDKSRLPAIYEAFDLLEHLVQGLIKRRREHPDEDNPEDLLHLLIATADEGGVGERQLADLIIFFFIAGYDTSKNVLTHTMYLLLQHPEIYQRCAEDYDYCNDVLNEALRYFNPGSVPRFTNEDVEFRGVVIPKDTMVWFNLNISGRDQGAFDDPDVFNPDRDIAPHQRYVSFSLGKHMCLGQYIARAQLQEGLHQIAQRIKDPKLVGDIHWRPYPGTWGLKGLPIEFTPA